MMSVYDSILVTGAGGMLGRAMTQLLRGRGANVVALRHADLDIGDAGAVAAAFEMHRPTLVLNCAAYTKVDLCEKETELCHRINGSAVGLLAENCRRAGAQIVHVSTDFVFDGAVGRPHRPDDAVNPTQEYGRSKLAGEKALVAANPAQWLIVRTSWVFGIGGVNFPRTIVNAARAGKPLSVVGDQRGCPTYASDLAAGILAMLDSGRTGIQHLTNNGATTWHEVATAALAEFGMADYPVKAITSAQWQAMRPDSAARPLYTVLESSMPLRDWRAAMRDFATKVKDGGWD
jgi:dTDP-4-dehydrorhamnose reductase